MNSCFRKITFIKITIFGIIAAIVLLSIISPKISATASNILNLKTIFSDEPMDEILIKLLDKKGYRISGISVDNSQKKVTIYVDGKNKYYNKVKAEIGKSAKDIFTLKNYDAFSINVSPKEILGKNDLTKDQKKLIEVINSKIYAYLDKLNIHSIDIQTTLNYNKSVYIFLLGTEAFTEEKFNEEEANIENEVKKF
jgi:hypothetical protein